MNLDWKFTLCLETQINPEIVQMFVNQVLFKIQGLQNNFT